MGKWRYGVILDAGSSGTRVHVYRWLNAARAREDAGPDQLHNLPELKTKKRWTKKIQPGVSTFGDHPSLVGPEHLRPLLDHALSVVPANEVENTPIFLLATAGVRLLPQYQQQKLLGEVCSYARANTNFQLPDCDLHIQVIPGETEGLYGWIAANYLLGGFDNAPNTIKGNEHPTYGFLDMGGASAQIAFEPNATETRRHAEDLKLLRMRTLDGRSADHEVFVTTWLGFGVHQARQRYVQHLIDASPSSMELPDPCLPRGALADQSTGNLIDPQRASTLPHLVGTGKFEECVLRTHPLLEKDAPCENAPCLLGGVHVPAIDFRENHFVGVSEFWHTTHEIFGIDHPDEPKYDFERYHQKVTDFCSQRWEDISSGVENHIWGKKIDEKKAGDACFKASWLLNMLHEGIGVPRDGSHQSKLGQSNSTKEISSFAKGKGAMDLFQPVDKIDGVEVSWTLGKMLLYASSQIPPAEESEDISGAVGFGSNVVGSKLPPDFQFAGGRPATLADDFADDPSSFSLGPDNDDHNLDWEDTLFSNNSSRRIPGVLLSLVLICLLLFYACRKERRNRLLHRTISFFSVISPFSRSTKTSWIKARLQRPSLERRKSGSFASSFFSKGRTAKYQRVSEDDFSDDDVELQAGCTSQTKSFSGDVGQSFPDFVSGGDQAAHRSGWSTPQLGVSSFDFGNGHNAVSASLSKSNSTIFNPAASGTVGLGLGHNAFSHSGLSARPESRERLAPAGSPPPLRPSNGARPWNISRSSSPSRSRSPMISPSKENID